MARLNTHPSATPLQTRSSTVDSLYRDPSVAPRNASSARGTTYSVMSPSQSSDKENLGSESRESTPQPAKRKGLGSASGRIPTPDTGSTVGSGGNKRQRTGTYDLNGGSEIYADEEEEPERAQRRRTATTQPEEEEEDSQSKLYNPNQDPNKRREVRYQLRENHRQLEDNRSEFVKANNTGLYELLRKNDSTFGKVRQTADATVDSRFLVTATDLANKKLQNSLHGSGGAGVDLDQFVSKCIYFMKSGGYRYGEEDAPTIAVADDEEDDTGDGLDWALFGRQACFPSNKRPPTANFLLGPLSVQKKVRTTQRRATQRRAPVGPATRPQEVKEGDITQSENANLTHVVKGIKSRLESHLNTAAEAASDEMGDIPEDDATEEYVSAVFARHRVAQTPEGEPAVHLFDFAINPLDFGQTVENLFYISFLVREGNAQIVKDNDGLPLLAPAAPRGVSEQRDQGAQKHQAVFSIDYLTWQMFTKAYGIMEPLIPHRLQEEDNGGSRWY
ncbi:Nse4-domain-containing protein [Didymella exigua CBS 183.55]|uniref:Non-structural maintenance of chromosomes element 4 n=1 Tax=Didymella exigua CBS 183.55 TaxID=1150837 RepID=A0A6A5RK33_9PLEO|nr:Nse4-domain-containing protein [Didymella exigua CBS 183.55]KAF1927324.1 Nse4-domain-containing protein [Didymella exigua CBS 183.55]